MAEAGGAEEAATEENVLTESLEEMLARHRKEITELQNKEANLKKEAAKGSKAEQKAKKKIVEEEISRLLSDLKIKHSEEISSRGDLKSDVPASGAAKPTKSAKRREKKAQKELEREQRIKEEQSCIVSDRESEDHRLEQKLGPLGLAVKEMKPDGHCLYRAVADQIAGGVDFLQLRKIAADYMREHENEFLPFFSAEGKVDFEAYCDEVERTAAWGGELELEALARSLKRRILVFSGSFPDVEMGKEYDKDGGRGSSILLSYHKHAYGLGEHYNSVVPSELGETDF